MDDKLQNLCRELLNIVILALVIVHKDPLNLVECFELLNLQEFKTFLFLKDFHEDFFVISNWLIWTFVAFILSLKFISQHYSVLSFLSINVMKLLTFHASWQFLQ